MMALAFDISLRKRYIYKPKFVINVQDRDKIIVIRFCVIHNVCLGGGVGVET